MSKNSNETIISVLDLTSLNENDTEENIIALTQKAKKTLVPVAAICVLPQFITTVKKHLPHHDTKIATVANFPEGIHQIDTVIAAINEAIKLKADEIDIVLPYHYYLENNKQRAIDFMRRCIDEINHRLTIKVILETGALANAELILETCHDMLQLEIDFIKTSTGKKYRGATLNDLALILAAIYEQPKQQWRGCKISGGIQTIEQAETFLQLTAIMMGEDYINPKHFRIGSSKLLDVLL